MKRKVITIGIAVVTFVLALAITLYPIISSRYNEQHQSEIHVSYQEKVEQVNTSAINEARELAKQYNQAILKGVKEAAFDHDTLLWASEDYEHQLNITGGGIMGYVEIPKIKVTLPIYHGTDDATLEKGVGHLLGSSLPVGGEGTHTVLTAHSGMASQRMFSDLDLLKIGDVFYLDVLGQCMAYQVDQIKTVLPYDTTYLGILGGEDHCTLVTCTPFGVNTHRLLVRGIRIPYDKSHCLDTQGEPVDYTGKVLVVSPRWLKDSYKKPEYQLFYADSGFGCSPKASGRKVFGQFLYDGEQTHLDRGDFIGILDDKHLPDWARVKLDEIQGITQGPATEQTM